MRIAAYVATFQDFSTLTLTGEYAPSSDQFQATARDGRCYWVNRAHIAEALADLYPTPP